MKINQSKTQVVKKTQTVESESSRVNELNNAFKEYVIQVIETMLQGELDSFIGCLKPEQLPKEIEDRRNDSFTKIVQSEFGNLIISVPGDRSIDFNPSLLPGGTTDIKGMEYKLLALCAKGTTDIEVLKIIKSIYGLSIRSEVISAVSERVLSKMQEWQTKQLQTSYPLLYIDSVFTIDDSQDKGIYRKVHSVCGLDRIGSITCVGFWVGKSDDAIFVSSVFEELKSRGVEEIGTIAIRGLSGSDEVKSIYPSAVILTK